MMRGWDYGYGNMMGGWGWAGAEGAPLASAGSSVTTGCVIGPVVGR